MSKTDDKSPVEHQCLLEHDGGVIEPVKLVHGEDDPCEPGGIIDLNHFDQWEGDDGQRRIRRTTPATTLGYGRKYSSEYDKIDWGN